ncbi:hypothetical protein D3C81_2016470 [compost metagenome]
MLRVNIGVARAMAEKGSSSARLYAKASTGTASNNEVDRTQKAGCRPKEAGAFFMTNLL